MAPKKDTKKMTLGEFLGDEKYGSWADEMDEVPISSTPAGGRTGYGNRDRQGFGGGGFGGGFGGSDRYERDSQREDRYPRRTELPIPTKPPFTAHVGNLSFDATEDDISHYFAQCSISSVRLVRDRMGDRPKGFGYVEFENVEGLKKALELNNGQLAGRNVRVSVADPPKDRPDDRTNVDTWRRSGPLPPTEAPPMRRNNSRFNDAASEAGSENFQRRGSGFNRAAAGEEGDGKFRDFNNWERKGPLTPSTPTETQSESGRPPRHDRGDRRRSPGMNPFDRERQPSFQGESSGERPERQRREYRPAPERAPTAAEKDNEWRKNAQPMAPPPPPRTQTAAEKDTEWRKNAQPDVTPEERERREQEAKPAAPAPQEQPKEQPKPQGRPKLNLLKRSETATSESEPKAGGDSKSSPFGAARPINTSEKETIAAEKILKQEAQRKERIKARAAEKAEKGEKTEKGEKPERGQRRGQKTGAADGEPETPKTGRNFDLLRRESAVTTDDVDKAELDTAEAPETKQEPAQPVQAVPKVQLPSEPATQQVDDEGWSTVKRGRGANGKV